MYKYSIIKLPKNDYKFSLMTIITVASLLIVDRQAISCPDKKLPKLSLVIPTFNGSQNITELVDILVELLDRTIPEDYELIVVDDNSPDRTWEVAEN